MTKEHIQIIADDREQQCDIPSIMARCTEVELLVKRLPCGDYSVGGWLLVERKTVSDLLLSIVDGRLFRQAYKLSQSAMAALLIVEGHFKEKENPALDRRAVLGALASLTLTFGIPVLRTQTCQETVQLMLYAAKQHQFIQHGIVSRGGYHPRSLHKRQLYVLQGFPGIGPALARNLLQTFGSLSAVFDASEAELNNVRGMGVTKAAGFSQLLGSQYKESQ
ncbi:hypothetical protein GCM10009092_29810 [Bowmanella denitrificans]|uniref:ERCC4 domain-containing protein n=1 Tax=Bowmanella denitrificans TaxID=366582 RepID=A0ABP3H7T7_9ALTE